jgi:drug/metabolite transporter (DMT)-like permease
MFEVLVPPIAVVAAIAWGETTMGALQFAGILMLLAGVALGTRVHLSAHAH